MDFSTRQLSNGKWAVYSGDQLLATVGCKLTCDTIMNNLMSGRRDAPIRDIDELYQAHKLRREIEAEKKAALENDQVAVEPNSVKSGSIESNAVESDAAKSDAAKPVPQGKATKAAIQEPAIV